MNKNNEHFLCSFCGKCMHQVKQLIAGPEVYICNECVDLCNDFFENADTEKEIAVQ